MSTKPLKPKLKQITNNMALSECMPAPPAANDLTGISQYVREVRDGQTLQSNLLSRLDAILDDACSDLFGPEPCAGLLGKADEAVKEPYGIIGRITSELADANIVQNGLNSRTNDLIIKVQGLFHRLGVGYSKEGDGA